MVPLNIHGRALLLLESGQAATARRRVEQYMSTVMAHIQEQGCEAASHCAIDDAAAAAVPQSRGDGCESWRQAPIKAGTAAESAAKKSWHGMADPVALVGVATATLPDRMALARLYSQDVLCLGLGLPLEALYWLQSILDTTGSQQQHLCCGKVNESAQLGSNVGIPAVAATAGVVDANELLGRCPETLQRLRDELNQLIAISGMAPLGLPDFTAATITGNRLSIDALAMVAVPGAVPGDRAASQIPHRGADGKVSAGDSRGAPTVPRRLQNNGTGHQQPIVSQLESGHASFLLFRALLASLHAAVRRLALGASLQLTRAQTWLICKVTAVAARLRDMSACRHAAAAGSWGRSIKRAAAMAGLAAVILLALQAEAPHVRTNMERQAGWIAGMVQDALRMGFALQPSPVAAGGPPMP
ncbi:hypothetical protein Vretimale_17887 [Volvox reticuliferus]|uniref:Uncharacterized protein n=1 Tax=Volvox reticuliferus TaxID=1737510 RepID=A0A8J4LYT4_9CHLO|nr:hypothetical protein Vretimale_17887 [Volvox reticuliferus]